MSDAAAGPCEVQARAAGYRLKFGLFSGLRPTFIRHQLLGFAATWRSLRPCIVACLTGMLSLFCRVYRPGDY